MATFKILAAGHSLSNFTLAATCYTKANYGVNTNTTLSASTPVGVLAGSVASIKAGSALTVEPGTLVNRPVGLFVKSASGTSWDANPAIASGKLTVASYAVAELDVYETRNAADNANLTYTEGDKLYSSAQGLLSKEASTETTVIGVVIKAPTVSAPSMIVKMLI